MAGVPGGEDETSSAATRVDQRSPFAVSDDTLPVKTGFRVALHVPGFRLVHGKQRREVTSGVAQLGTLDSNELVLTDSTVSRIHCEVRMEEQRPIVRDLGSTNGTLLDGVRVREGYLRDGSVLTLGRAEVRFELLSAQQPAVLSAQARFGELLGSSAAMRAAFAVLEKAAATDSTLILEGETGVGKSRAAQALHAMSPRAKKPFLVVDCGALPPSLLEAELFGHEKGAFTGATGRRLGVFEEADGGTVLLDELGELPLELQPRLLRVLEDKSVRRLGQNQWTKVDVRILAATHRDLRADVNSGRFRGDLYFRLAVARVRMPSLREHREDVPELARALLKALGSTPARHPTLHAAPFLESLALGTWPGNVRELRNHLERCILFEEPQPLADAGAPLAAPLEPGLPFTEARGRALAAFERTYLEQLLARHGGKVSLAAVEAGVDRVYLYRLMRKHGLKAKG